MTPEKAIWWVKLYCYITVIAVVYGLACAHVPFIIGSGWSTCTAMSSELYGVLILHLYEVPVTLFNIYVAWYGLKRFSLDRIQLFMSLLTFSLAANITFFLFECELVLGQLSNSAPQWEIAVTTTLALMMLGGSALAIIVRQKLVHYTYNYPV